MNRRDVLRAIALGGGVVAGELWIPGARMISIPRADLTYLEMVRRVELWLSEESVEEICVDIVDRGGLISPPRMLKALDFRAPVAQMMNEAYQGIYDEQT